MNIKFWKIDQYKIITICWKFIVKHYSKLEGSDRKTPCKISVVSIYLLYIYLDWGLESLSDLHEVNHSKWYT